MYMYVWYGVVWYGMAWHGMVWYGMVWYGMVWYGMYVFFLSMFDGWSYLINCLATFLGEIPIFGCQQTYPIHWLKPSTSSCKVVLLEGKGSVLLALEGACRKQRTVQMESLRSGEVGTCGVVGLSEFGDMSAWNRYGFRAKLEIFVRIRLGKLGAGNLAAKQHFTACLPLWSAAVEAFSWPSWTPEQVLVLR